MVCLDANEVFFSLSSFTKLVKKGTKFFVLFLAKDICLKIQYNVSDAQMQSLARKFDVVTPSQQIRFPLQTALATTIVAVLLHIYFCTYPNLQDNSPPSV